MRLGINPPGIGCKREGLVTAAQEQALRTNLSKAHIDKQERSNVWKKEGDSKSRSV